MGEWPEVKLNEIADVQTGPFGSQLHASDYVETGIPAIMPKDIGQRLDISLESIAYITEKEAQRLQRYRVKPYDLVFSRRGDVEKCAFITEEMDGWLCGTGCLKISFFKDANVNPKFMAYYFSTRESKFWLTSHAVGTTMPNLNSTILGEFPVELPQLGEQEAIAGILSSLDDKIDLLHRQNQTLEALAQTLFRHWLIDNAQDDWEEGTLGDVIEIYDSQRIPLSKMERDKMKDGELFPYYGAASIMDYVNQYIFDGEYILMGEDGTVQTSEGYPILQYATGKFWVNNHAHIFQAKKPYSNFLVWCYLKQKDINEIVTGAVQPKINQGNLRSLDFPLAPLALIFRFDQSTEALFDKIKANQAQIKTLEKLRDMLLPKLMSGEVRVLFSAPEQT